MLSYVYKALQKHVLANTFQKHKSALWIFSKYMGGHILW